MFSKLLQVNSKLLSQKFLIQLSIKNIFDIFVSSHLRFVENGGIVFITKVFSSKKIHSCNVFIFIQTVFDISDKLARLQD